MLEVHQRCEQAIEVLKATNDGDDLDPSHLAIIEAHVNGHLSEKGQQVFEEIYKQVKEGKYVKPWLCGVENLTRDTRGFVYWKGIEVEHYSHRDYEKMKKDAKELGRRCRIIESSGQEVSCKSVIWDWDKNKPKGGF
jgi:hypothetical protein